jgi:hypothetical protein
LDEETIKELSFDIVEQYRTLSIAELKMMLGNALKQSKKLFNLDYQTLMVLIDEKAREKLEFATKNSIREHNEMTNQEKGEREKEETPNYSAQNMSIADQVQEIKRMAKPKK